MAPLPAGGITPSVRLLPYHHDNFKTGNENARSDLAEDFAGKNFCFFIRIIRIHSLIGIVSGKEKRPHAPCDPSS